MSVTGWVLKKGPQRATKWAEATVSTSGAPRGNLKDSLLVAQMVQLTAAVKVSPTEKKKGLWSVGMKENLRAHLRAHLSVVVSADLMETTKVD